VRLPKDYYAGFVELHIEQGPLAVNVRGFRLGLSPTLPGAFGAAKSRLKERAVTRGGALADAVTARDAFCAAAEIVLAVGRAARRERAQSIRAGTVGKCSIHPGAVNSVPSRVQMEVDVSGHG